MTSRSRILTAGLGAALLVAPLAATSAQAATTAPTAPTSRGTGLGARCDSTGLANAQAHVAAAIARRQSALTALSTRVGSASHLTSAHRGTIDATIAADRTGLAQVGATVAADPTCAAVIADAPHLVTDYYVLALVVPQTGLTIAADSGLSATAALTAAEPAVAAAIRLMPAGAAKTAAQASDADLVAQVAAATGDFTGVGDAVLALTPATFATRTGVLRAQGKRVASGGVALKAALVDAQQLAADLG